MKRRKKTSATPAAAKTGKDHSVKLTQALAREKAAKDKWRTSVDKIKQLKKEMRDKIAKLKKDFKAKSSATTAKTPKKATAKKASAKVSVKKVSVKKASKTSAAGKRRGRPKKAAVVS